MPYSDPARQREYMRQWMARRRAEWFADKACASCGSTENLELDHIDPSRKITHAIWSWSAERREAELAKCQPLCTECHKIKTTLDRPPIPHGTHTRYVKYGCRCTDCRRAHAATNRKYRGGLAQR